ncbi:MAG TPA: hypothetical protein VHP11_13620 [Tepidisphaeraceae bacterium]|nr:hypothetical protein [Tepidisphaeraceae bacterium]
MLQFSLRDEVQKAVASEWKEFVERHPRLAEVIDQTLLVEQTTLSLVDDDEFHNALDAAAVAGATTQTLVELVRQFVQGWLKRLI